MAISGKEKLASLIKDTGDEIRSFLNADILELSLNREETEQLKKERSRLRNAIKRCSMGDRDARQAVKDHIRSRLEGKPGLKNIKSMRALLDFGSPYELPAGILFSYLYFDIGLGSEEAFGDVCGDLQCLKDTAPENGYDITEKDIRRLFDRRVNEPQELVIFEVIVQMIYEELYGFGAADLLIMDRSLDGVSGGCGGRTEIDSEKPGQCGNRDYDTIYVMFRGMTVRLSFLSFGSEKVLQRTVKKLCRNDVGSVLCRKNPLVVCQLADNSRVVVSRPPYSSSWTFYVRRFSSSEARDIESLFVDEGKERVIYLLKLLTASEQNFVISGNQGGGKTTLLKSLVRYIDPRYTIRVAENTFELNLNNLYPERNVHSLQEREGYTVYSSITAFKKMDSDVTILGEINEPKLAGAFVQLVQNGGRMAISTLHHNTTEKLIAYLRNALVSEFGISDVAVAERQVVDSVNFDVHMVRGKDGHHFVERITEIVPLEKSTLDRGELFECRDILRFDPQAKCYVFEEPLSSQARERIRATLGGWKVLEAVGYMKRERGIRAA